MMNGTFCNSSINDSCEVYNDNDTRVYHSFTYDVSYLVVCSVISLLGTTGNGLVIWFCLFKMEKTVNVIWFLNLSIADFVFALFLAFLFTDVYIYIQELFGFFMYIVTDFLFFLNMSVSVLQLAVISVDRCICVVFPVWCHNHRTRRPALIIVLIIWVISIASNGIIYFNTDIDLVDYYWTPIVRFVFFCLLPFIVIVSSYTILFLSIKDKSIIKTSKPFKIMVAVVIAFFICWFPFYLFLLIPSTNTSNVYRIGRTIALFLMYCNCCINPILYVFIGRDFKQKFCGSFQSTFEKAFREDMNQMNFKKHEQGGSSGLSPALTNTSLI